MNDRYAMVIATGGDPVVAVAWGRDRNGAVPLGAAYVYRCGNANRVEEALRSPACQKP